MRYSILGATGVKVSRICLGTATFGVAPTAQDADRVVGSAIDVGINFVDTADVYGNMPVFDRPRAPAAPAPAPAPRRPPPGNPPSRSSAALSAAAATRWWSPPSPTASSDTTSTPAACPA